MNISNISSVAQPATEEQLWELQRRNGSVLAYWNGEQTATFPHGGGVKDIGFFVWDGKFSVHSLCTAYGDAEQLWSTTTTTTTTLHLFTNWTCGIAGSEPSAAIRHECEDSQSSGLRHCEGINKVVSWGLPSDVGGDFLVGATFAMKGWVEVGYIVLGREVLEEDKSVRIVLCFSFVRISP